VDIGIGYFRLLVTPSNTLVSGDFDGIKVLPPLPCPSSGFSTVLTLGANHGSALFCVSHPSDDNCVYIGTDGGVVLLVSDVSKEAYRYNDVAHSNEITCLSIVDDILLSSSIDCTVVRWSSAVENRTLISYSRTVSHNSPLLAVLGLSSDLIACGDKKGNVSVWERPREVFGSDLDVPLDEGTRSGAFLRVRSCYRTASKYTSSKTGRQTRDLVVTTLHKGCPSTPVHAEGGWGAGPLMAQTTLIYSANNCGEVRTWIYTGNFEHPTNQDFNQLNARLQLLHSFHAHQSTVDNLLTIGDLLFTAGAAGEVKVWGASADGRGWEGGHLATLVVGDLPEGSAKGMIDPRWDQKRVVGLDFRGGELVCLRQDGVVTVFRFAEVDFAEVDVTVEHDDDAMTDEEGATEGGAQEVREGGVVAETDVTTGVTTDTIRVLITCPVCFQNVSVFSNSSDFALSNHMESRRCRPALHSPHSLL
jgi:hypothetical protein